MQEIARELSKGNVEKAREIKVALMAGHDAYDIELIEIVRQAIISYIKKGEVDKACKARELFEVPQDLADEALKQAVLSSYYEGDLKRLIDIKNTVPMSEELRREIVDYCESWGRHEEAKAMRGVFLEPFAA